MPAHTRAPISIPDHAAESHFQRLETSCRLREGLLDIGRINGRLRNLGGCPSAYSPPTAPTDVGYHDLLGGDGLLSPARPEGRPPLDSAAPPGMAGVYYPDSTL